MGRGGGGEEGFFFLGGRGGLREGGFGEGREEAFGRGLQGRGGLQGGRGRGRRGASGGLQGASGGFRVLGLQGFRALGSKKKKSRLEGGPKDPGTRGPLTCIAEGRGGRAANHLIPVLMCVDVCCCVLLCVVACRCVSLCVPPSAGTPLHQTRGVRSPGALKCARFLVFSF